MSSTKLKSLDEIVADLRAKGELDEEKWLKLKNKQKGLSTLLYGLSLFLVFGSIFKAVNTGGLINVLGLFFIVFPIVYYLIFVMLRNTINNNLTMVYLASYGARHKATVKNVRRGGMGYVELTCSAKFGDQNIANKLMVSGNFLGLYDYPSIGDEIDIIYDKDNTSLFRFYNAKLNDFYCLKRK
jgi:hypothetical protein